MRYGKELKHDESSVSHRACAALDSLSLTTALSVRKKDQGATGRNPFGDPFAARNQNRFRLHCLSHDFHSQFREAIGAATATKGQMTNPHLQRLNGSLNYVTTTRAMAKLFDEQKPDPIINRVGFDRPSHCLAKGLPPRVYFMSLTAAGTSVVGPVQLGRDVLH